MLEVAFAGIEARPADAGGGRRRSRAAEAIVVCPSNPFVSIGPILAVPGMRRAARRGARARGVRVVAVSPLVGGRALKGPADRMASRSAARRARPGSPGSTPGSSTRCSIDDADAAEAPAIAALGIEPVVGPTVMTDDASRAALAAAAVAAASRAAS